MDSARSTALRADELFHAHQRKIYVQTDRLFARLMIVQWLAAVIGALIISPRTWAGQTSQIHIHVWASLIVGGLITIFPVWLTRAWPGTLVTRYVIAVAQMLMSALLISVTGGRIETHFHVFGSLVILSFYRDWRVLVPATLVVALDHFLRGVYWPYSVYGVLNASPWRSIEHAGWVVFEDVFLVISCFRSMQEMRSIANRTAALEASEQNFRQLFEANQLIMDNSQDVICTIDEHGRFVTVNAASQDLWGYSPGELTGRPSIDFVAPEDRARTIEADANVRRLGKLKDFVNRYIRKDGTIVDVLWSASWSETNRVYFCVAHDVTERERTEQQLRLAKDEADRANNAKSEFLSRMSHELRTPLNAILGFSQLLERQNPTETQRARVTHIMNAGRHLLDLINEVLDLSRIEAGRMQLSVEPVSVAVALAEAIDLMRPMAAERSIDLITPPDIDPSWHVLADRQRLKQVLLNLLTNGVKYTPAKGRVAVSVAPSSADKYRIVVSDTGAGISPDKLSRVFTPFDRLGAEQSEVQGTGLGLALSRRLIDSMGGSIGLTSDLGHGSTFWIELPQSPSPLQTVGIRARKTEPRLPLTTATDKRRILYIEDNLSNLTLIEQILEEHPEVELMTAMQGNIGLELARRHEPDLILLDLHLPDIPGWDVLAKLKESERTSDIPAVVISADATARQIERLLALGARGYLTKPLNVDQFLRVLADSRSAPNQAPEPANYEH